MGKSIKVQKKPRSTVKDKPRKRQDTPDWDDGHDKYMLLNVFHLLNVGKPNFRQLSEAMGKRAYSEHHLRSSSSNTPLKATANAIPMEIETGLGSSGHRGQRSKSTARELNHSL